ncbi:hypothetical protein HanRHA438_Chr16g0760311 [Helianthus annuus]|nr:hypothetical protein HanIR_Chr16g0813511 [Helianthus annuus]KAJ0644817.1 hypothetical protein HanOQP8_Chr16g0616621 [Helianthus annuus]KAJ0835872.1 hypothetical protein HanRHA438_Chr16g0760311 [Helianthus annuus]
MHYHLESEGIPRVNMSINFTEQEWALVVAGMSMLWAPQNPRGFLVYGYRGKAGYSLMNVFDPKAGGAMVVASLPEGRPLWLDHIRDNFLHPSNESMANYANTILGDNGEDGIGFNVNPTREEPILLSSEESDDASFHLIRRSSRAGPQRGSSEEPASDDARKKKKEDKTGDKKVEEPVAETPRKHPSNSYFLDYVVVSDTLSGLDAGAKRQSRDPDDDSTLTEMMKKRKLLEDKKKELDVQAATALAEKKSKLQKETTAAPSESEIDLGVSSKKTGNRLEKIFKSASGSRGMISSVVGKVLEDVAAGAGRDESHAEGVETEVESSEATPQGTIYTKRVRSSGGGGTSGVPQSLEFHRVQGGSWTSHNPACDDLPHAPHWTLTQGSRMNDLSNCREFYSLSLPPAERLF